MVTRIDEFKKHLRADRINDFRPQDSNLHWYSLNYQSNSFLNIAAHYKIKKDIALLLAKQPNINDMHSRMQGSIIFSIQTINEVGTYETLLSELDDFMPNLQQDLMFTLVLAYKDLPSNDCLFSRGSDEIDENFLESIKDFFPS